MKNIIVIAATFCFSLMGLSAISPAFAQKLDALGLPVQPVAKTWADRSYTGPDGTVFHYMEQGKGTPVILIHGFGASAAAWFNIGAAQKLAKTNRVIAMDARGHGTTGPSPADTTGTMVHDIMNLMDHLKINKAHIIGYSMGGATTVGLLKEAPERFITAGILGSGVTETAEWTGNIPKDSPARLRAQVPGAPTAPRPPGMPNSSQDVDLSTIKFPVLSINGADDNPLVKTHRMWRQLQDLTFIVIPGRNHGEASRDPRLVNAIVHFVVDHNPDPKAPPPSPLPTGQDLLKIKGP